MTLRADSLWRLAVRNVLRQRLRAAMTLGAIAFGVTALIVSAGFIQDTYAQLAETLIHSQTGHMQLAKRGFFGAGSRSPEKYLIEDSEKLKQHLAQTPSLKTIMARISFSGLLSNGRSELPIVGEGVEPELEADLNTHLQIIRGKALDSKTPYGAILGEGLAATLGLKPGDSLTLLVSTPEGATNTVDLNVSGVFQSFAKDYDARAVRLPLVTAQELLNTSGTNLLVVALKETAMTDEAQAAIAQRLPQDIELKTWRKLADLYEKTVALYDRQFFVLQFIILIMVVLGVANTVNMSVFERIAEYGTMMAMGNRRRDIFLLILCENFVLGCMGALLGVAIGLTCAALISSVGIDMPPPPNSNIGYTALITPRPVDVAVAVCVGIFATLIAALPAGYRTARMQIVEALRHAV